MTIREEKQLTELANRTLGISQEEQKEYSELRDRQHKKFKSLGYNEIKCDNKNLRFYYGNH